jgi:hypothetical protein
MPESVHSTVKEPAEKADLYEGLYITEHSVAHDFDFDADFRLNRLPGLLFCQVVKSGAERRVVAWWKSKETFAEAWKKQFAQVLKKTDDLTCFEGFQLAHRVRPDPFWWLRPAPLLAAVSTLVAFITGFATIQDWGYSLLAIPDCTLWTDPVAAAKPIAVGEPFGVPVQVKNRHLRASSAATIEAIFLGDGLKRTDSVNPYPVRVDPGKAEVQEFRLTAVRGGQHTITFGGKQQGGILHPERNIPPLTITMDAWDAIDQTPHVSLVKANDRSASVSVDVRNSRPTPYGTAFEATLTNPEDVDVRADRLTIKDFEDPLRNTDFAQLRWRIPASADALKIQSCRLVLQEAGAKTRSQAEWKELLKRLIVHADEPDELTFSGQTK